MDHRHEPRLCQECTAPLSRQQDTCWKCGATATADATTAPGPPRLRVLPGGQDHALGESLAGAPNP